MKKIKLKDSNPQYKSNQRIDWAINFKNLKLFTLLIFEIKLNFIRITRYKVVDADCISFKFSIQAMS